MGELSLKRRNGWLYLDDHFRKNLGRDFLDLEDLIINGLIELEPTGRSEKFWILSNDGSEKIALFKEQAPDSNEAYAELFAEEIAKILGMRAAHYDLAMFDGKKGVISYNFLNEYDSFYAGFDMIADFYEEKLVDDERLSSLYDIDYEKDSIEDAVKKLNNLEDIWLILENKFIGNNRQAQMVSTIMDGLVDKIIFDIITINVDDHSDNWAVVDSIEEGKTISHQYDSARIMNLHNNILMTFFNRDKILEDKELSLTVDNTENRKPLEVLRRFLDISSSGYRDRVIGKVNILQENIDIIPALIEQRTEHNMPEYLKNYFTSTMHNHLDKINEVIYGKRILRK